MKIEKILIVDDEQPIHSYLQRKLSKLGYQALVAEDGERAMEVAFSNLPDIILLDVKLPKLNGLEVCRALKSDEKTRHIPIIILSAKAQAAEVKRGLDAGADRYLCKPLGFPEILRELKSFEE